VKSTVKDKQEASTHMGGPIQVVSEELMFNSLTLHRIDSSFHQAMNRSQFMFMTLIKLFTILNLPLLGKKVENVCGDIVFFLLMTNQHLWCLLYMFV